MRSPLNKKQAFIVGFVLFLTLMLGGGFAIAGDVKDRLGGNPDDDEDALMEPEADDMSKWDAAHGVGVDRGAGTGSATGNESDDSNPGAAVPAGEMKAMKEDYDREQAVKGRLGIVEADVEIDSDDGENSTTGTAAAPSIVLALNGMGSISKNIFPILAKKYGLDKIKKSATLYSRKFKGYAYDDAKKKYPYDCFSLKVAYSLTLRMPLDGNDVTAAFKGGNGLKTKFDLDADNSIKGTVTVTTEYGDDASNYYCWAADFLGALIGDQSMTVTTGDFSGTVDVVLAAVGNVVQLDEIDLYEFDADVDVTGTGSVGELIEDVIGAFDTALSVSDFFGLSDCDDVGSCVGDLAISLMKDASIQDLVLGMINAAIEYSAKVEDDVPISSSGYSLAYSISLSSLSSAKGENTLKTWWPTEMSLAEEKKDSCAGDLKGYSPSSVTTATIHEDNVGTDYSAAIPLSLIGRSLYYAFEEGKACDDLESTGSQGTVSFEMRPFGTIEVVVPEPSEGEEHAKKLIVVVPVRLRNFAMTGPSTLEGVGEITAKLALYAGVGMSGNNLVLNFKSPTLKHFNGKVIFGNGVVLRGADLESNMPSLGTPNPLILPRVTNISELDGLGVKIKKAFYTEDAAQLGLDIAVDE